MCTHLQKLKYSTPTAVQQAVIPLLLKGRDVLMRAPTGTGKTLAYLAPLVQLLGSQEPRISRSDGCHAIIVTPTRELTAQVAAPSHCSAPSIPLPPPSHVSFPATRLRSLDVPTHSNVQQILAKAKRVHAAAVKTNLWAVQLRRYSLGSLHANALLCRCTRCLKLW